MSFVKVSGFMATQAQALEQKLGVMVHVVREDEFIPHLQRTMTKHYHINFVGLYDGQEVVFRWQQQNANQVKRSLAAMMDLLNLGFIKPSELLSSPELKFVLTSSSLPGK